MWHMLAMGTSTKDALHLGDIDILVIRDLSLPAHQHYSPRLAAIKVEEQGCSGATERGVFRPVITS